MKIAITGASGVLGSALIPELRRRGHEVRALVRSDESAKAVDEADANPVICDLFDPRSIQKALASADVVFHLATAIPPFARMVKTKAWAMNDRIRSEATSLLANSAREAGAQRFVVASVALVYATGGDKWLTEADTVRPPWRVIDSALDAERTAEAYSEEGRTGIALRLGRLYGPGKASHEFVHALRARKAPVIGNGQNYVPYLHVQDAGTALAAALEAPAGIYNVAEDEPARNIDGMRFMAEALDARPPVAIPAWTARVLVGRGPVRLATCSQRIRSSAFREATGWQTRYPSIREGWPTVMAGV
jgi:nucleoside-diphosphate-sugar epimerase